MRRENGHNPEIGKAINKIMGFLIAIWLHDNFLDDIKYNYQPYLYSYSDVRLSRKQTDYVKYYATIIETAIIDNCW